MEVKNTMIYHFYGFCTLVRCREGKIQKSADVACPNVGLSIDSHAQQGRGILHANVGGGGSAIVVRGEKIDRMCTFGQEK